MRELPLYLHLYLIDQSVIIDIKRFIQPAHNEKVMCKNFFNLKLNKKNESFFDALYIEY